MVAGKAPGVGLLSQLTNLQGLAQGGKPRHILLWILRFFPGRKERILEE